VWPYYLKTRKSRPLDEFLSDTIALCAPLGERLRHAQRITPAEATGNYSYACDRTHGRNYLLLGDAYAFIDPVFSSGVMLAMHSAFVGADTVDTCLREPRRAAAALRAFDRSLRKGPRAYTWFIYRVTNPTLRNMLMSPSNIFRVKEALLSVLAGDVFGRTPTRLPLLAFKALYYAFCLLNLGRTLEAGRARKHNIRVVDGAGAAAS
jgi:2-polyprenyl-6-methoxyphenol hydroxylase-like FAD-dependent oxidoreductase